MLSDINSIGAPFFSIIIPVYNAGPFIGRCLDSILEQSFQNYEIITVDDCSKDDSLNVLNEYSKKYPVIRVIHQEKNGGSVLARETGLLNSNGEYIIYVDADDYYLSNKRLEHIYEEIQRTGADIVATGIRIGKNHSSARAYQNKLPFGFYDKEKYSELKPNIFGFCKSGTNRMVYPSLCLKATKRELYMVSIGKTSKTLKIGDDLAMSFPALALAKSISVIDEPTYFYYFHPFQMTKGYYKNYFKEALNNLITIENTIKENTNSTDFHFAIQQNICHISAYAIMNEARNPDKNDVKRILIDIVNNQFVIDAINGDAKKHVNWYYKIVIHFMRRKNYSMLRVLGKMYCVIMQ